MTVQARGWNIADAWEAIADRVGDRAAAIHGDLVHSWSQFDRRADGIAAALLADGAQQQDKVAIYLYNGPEYLESIYAAFKAALVPVNTNYRYTASELVYLWDNADATVVVFHGEFTERCAEVRPQVPGVRTWLWVDDGSGPCPSWAVPYEQAATSGAPRVQPPWGRSPDDLLFIYTGGTTGMPKGVMWRQTDLFNALENSQSKPLPPHGDLEALADRAEGSRSFRNLPGAPLMHGTGQFNAIANLNLGGTIVTMPNRRFDPAAMLDTTERHQVSSASIVGDAFAKPILAALDAEPDRWDLSAFRVIVSSGVMFSAQVKAGLIGHIPRLIVVDTLGSSEAVGMATSTTRAGAMDATATFKLSANARVITEDGRDVVPGSGERGRVALVGYTPVGYYKDPDKSADTFEVHDGVRYSIPGDWATVDVDGTVNLLGRGSQCINTGGEKVFPEEVEEALKLHAAVLDAAVVGVPDERFGEAIVALVQLVPTAMVSVDDLVAHVKGQLAAYKAPKRVLFIDDVARANNGKLDYRSLKDKALAQLG